MCDHICTQGRYCWRKDADKAIKKMPKVERKKRGRPKGKYTPKTNAKGGTVNPMGEARG